MEERKYIEYTAKYEDRWDLIAYKFWGDCNLAPLLIVDNKHISINVSEYVPEGVTVYVRETIEDEKIEQLYNENLPFWKR